MASFSQEQLQAIADALADTSEGLRGPEIGHLLTSCRIKDTDPAITKRHRLYNAFAHEQNTRRDRTR
ncbi:TIGR02391 family protein, partial [Mesorhizobium sp. M1D.F.Ca.ET.234.01.1.1]